MNRVRWDMVTTAAVFALVVWLVLGATDTLQRALEDAFCNDCSLGDKVWTALSLLRLSSIATALAIDWLYWHHNPFGPRN